MSEELCTISVGDIVYWKNGRKIKSGPAEVIEILPGKFRLLMYVDSYYKKEIAQTSRFNIGKERVLNVKHKADSGRTCDRNH